MTSSKGAEADKSTVDPTDDEPESSDTGFYSPITLGHLDYWPDHRQVCINLSAQPVFDFDRVLQLTLQQPAWLQLAREHYQAYQAQGCDLHHHPGQSVCLSLSICCSKACWAFWYSVSLARSPATTWAGALLTN